jgi:hypothetical protein
MVCYIENKRRSDQETVMCDDNEDGPISDDKQKGSASFLGFWSKLATFLRFGVPENYSWNYENRRRLHMDTFKQNGIQSSFVRPVNAACDASFFGLTAILYRSLRSNMLAADRGEKNQLGASTHEVWTFNRMILETIGGQHGDFSSYGLMYTAGVVMNSFKAGASASLLARREKSMRYGLNINEKYAKKGE